MRLSSLEIQREVEWKPDVAILFVSYEQDRLKRNEVVIMRKDAATGYGVRAREEHEERLYGGIDDKQLIKEMEEWKAKARPDW